MPMQELYSKDCRRWHSAANHGLMAAGGQLGMSMEFVQAQPGGRLQGLAPVADGRTRALVLGSFPGVRSLQLQQYYGHPQNQFWRLMQALWPQHVQPPREDYAGRCEGLLERGLGLWDVYDSCERKGSLDSAIHAAQVNDFVALRQQCPQLKLALHNGGESYKHARQTQALGLVAVKLPSTSPANASWSFEKKLQAWREALTAHGLL